MSNATLSKNEVVSAEVREYFAERPHLIDAQPDAEALWHNLNGRGRLSARTEAVYRKATKSKRVLVRKAPADLVTLTGPKGRKITVSAAAIREVVGAKHTGRFSDEQKRKAFEHFAA